MANATAGPFRLSDPVPQPDDLSAALDYAKSTTGLRLLRFRKRKITRLRAIRAPPIPPHAIWVDASPPEILEATGVHTTLITHLRARLGDGGSRWVGNFVHGFDAMGAFPQEVVCPSGASVAPPLSVGSPLFGATDICAPRAQASGYAHTSDLWEEASSPAKTGWPTGPFELYGPVDFLHLERGSHDVASRFEVVQMGMVRSRDDFKYGRNNIACDSRAPITPPHLRSSGQLRLDLRAPDRSWRFFKADRIAAYKNLPLKILTRPHCVSCPFEAHRATNGMDFYRVPCYSAPLRRLFTTTASLG